MSRPHGTTVTPRIAALLVRFGVTHGYTVVEPRRDSTPHTTPFAQSGQGRIATVPAFETLRTETQDGRIGLERVGTSRTLSCDDVVVVEPPGGGSDEEGGEARRYAWIRSMEDQQVHGYVVVSRLATLLGSFGEPNELFLTHERISLAIETIRYRLVRGTYLFRYGFDAQRPAFISLRQWIPELERRERREAEWGTVEGVPIRFVGGTTQHGAGFAFRPAGRAAVVEVHTGDFVYSLPEAVPTTATLRRARRLPFTIFRIETVTRAANGSGNGNDEGRGSGIEVTLRRFQRQALQAGLERYYANPRALLHAPFKDERRLLPTRRIVALDGARHVLVGRCTVSVSICNGSERRHVGAPPSPSVCDEDDVDHFYVLRRDLLRVLHRATLDPCRSCSDERTASAPPPLRTKLVALDLFCGAGGLSLGLSQSQATHTHWAIDHDLPSLQTFQHHHPTTSTIWEDTNLALRAALDPLRPPASLPRPGQIDLLAAGPPCQGFSQLNRTANLAAPPHSPLDPRNQLLFTLLGYLDALRPRFLLLENVAGLLSAPLLGRRRGYLRLLLVALTSLHYSVALDTLQAGRYGVAQSRTRVFLWAAQRAYPLPLRPLPTHVFLGQPARRFRWTDGYGRVHLSAGEAPAAWERSAPLPATTVGDAICDLVPPRHPSAPPRRYTPYPLPAKTTFQHRLRTSHPHSPSLTHHRSPPLPFPSQRHRSTRLSYHSYFPITLTNPTVATNDTTRLLHPTQDRVLTVREQARAQGFPDGVVFASPPGRSGAPSTREAYRQVGNAVSVPVGKCLGLALKRAVTGPIDDTM